MGKSDEGQQSDHFFSVRLFYPYKTKNILLNILLFAFDRFVAHPILARIWVHILELRISSEESFFLPAKLSSPLQGKCFFLLRRNICLLVAW